MPINDPRQRDFLIMVVDDEADFLSSMEFWFRAQGYQVVTAASGEEALRLLKVRIPDVVFLDHSMPGMTGVETLALIRRGHPRLPVIILTAHADEKMRLEAHRYGVNGVFDKTLDFYKAEHLLNSLVRVVSRQRARRCTWAWPSWAWIPVIFAALLFAAGFFVWATLFAVPEVCFDRNCVSVELAKTEPERSRGLMGRTALAEDKGMLFLFPEDGFWSFWMKDTLIPLDVIWLDKDRRVVEIVAEAPPQPGVLSPPSFGGTYPSRSVLEVKAGLAARWGVKIGDRARFRWISSLKPL